MNSAQDREPGYLRLRQICLVAPELAPAVDTVETVLGLSVCHRDPHLAEYGLENAIFPVHNRFIEIVAPIRPDTSATRFLDRGRSRGGYIVIFDCHDPEARRKRVETLGVRIANVFDLPEFTGIQLHPRDCRAAMLEFDRSGDGRDVDGAYWPAGPDWQAHVDTSVTERLAGVDMCSDAPRGLAAHWANIIDATTHADGHDYPTIAVDEQTLRFVPGAGGQRERFCAVRLEVRDPTAVLARARSAGLVTESSAFAFCGIRWRL